MADNVAISTGSDANVTADEVTYSGDTAKLQIVRPAYAAGPEGSKTVVDQATGAGAVNTGTQRTTLASDDPAVTVLGAVGDAAATQGSSGSISAKLRTVTAQLNTLAGHLDGVEGLLGGTITVGGTVELGATALAALETITVASVTAAIPAGTNNIGDVDVATQIGAANLANAQVTVDTTSGGVTVAASRATRRSVTIVNHGTTAVYVGAGTVSASNGALLPGTAGAALTLNVTGAVKAITASGSAVVGVLEEYD